MNIKVGDKLLCKKSYKYNSHIKGKYYTITKIKDNVYVDLDYDDWFSLYPNNIWYIWNFFYTPQEVRKLKLKKLNDVKSR